MSEVGDEANNLRHPLGFGQWLQLGASWSYEKISSMAISGTSIGPISGRLGFSCRSLNHGSSAKYFGAWYHVPQNDQIQY